METSHGSSYQNESLANTFQLNTRDIEGDIIKVKNLLLGLDFSHSHYYLEIMYKMITVEAMEVEQQYHRRILELYILVSIYTQDFSQALLLMRENAGNGSTRCRCQFRFPVSVFYGAGAYV